MFKLLKGGHCFTPFDKGKKDILIACNKIYQVEDHIEEAKLWDLELFECKDKIVCPGFIDQHVHIIGGGGEEGPVSRIPELMLSDIITAGITTLVGVLGVDSVTRSIAGLLAKAKALQIEGVNTYIYTGSYSVPTATLTGKALTDLVLIDKVIGIGEIAISDHRSSHPSQGSLYELAYEARVGGMIGGKAGIVHIHVGDGKEGINPLIQLVQESDFPKEMFVPTHVNRNKALFEQSMEYTGSGGNMDLTAGESSENGYSVPDALEMIVKNNIDIGKVTISSDGNGSIPAKGSENTGVGKVKQLFEDIRKCVLEKHLHMEDVLKTVTSNVANILKIYPQKGTLSCGSDADILVLNQEDMSIHSLFINGEVFIKDGEIIRKGRYEG